MTRPQVECDVVHPGLPVTDVAAAVEHYTRRLGFTLAFAEGDFAGVNLGKAQIFLEKGTPNASSVYFVVEDADELHAHHVAQGVDVVRPPRDQAWGLRDYAVRDPFGHTLTFAHRLHDAGEPVVVERVDVTVRLEKRLAALLRDLAAHRRTTVGGCLEEILLHTNEGVGPHTARTLRHIQELKRKHGIDYDTHASYRFTEG